MEAAEFEKLFCKEVLKMNDKELKLFVLLLSTKKESAISKALNVDDSEQATQLIIHHFMTELLKYISPQLWYCYNNQDFTGIDFDNIRTEFVNYMG